MIADDHDLIREGIKHILENYDDIAVVAEAGHGDDILPRLGDHKIDILLLDISMPGPGFISIMQQVRKKHPGLRILVLSMHPEEHYAMRAIKAGASGYMEKNLTPEDLYLALRSIHKGRQYITSALQGQIMTDKEKWVDAALHERLSERELQIMLMIGAGKTVAEISRDLHLSPKTVSTYRKRILEKMGFGKNSELIRYSLVNELL